MIDELYTEESLQASIEEIERNKQEVEGLGISVLGSLWDRVSIFFERQWSAVWSSLIPFIDPVVSKITSIWKKDLVGLDDRVWDYTFDILRDMKMISDDQILFLAQYKELPGVMSLIVWFILLNNFLVQWLWNSSKGMTANMERSFNQAYRPTLADSQALIRSAFIAPEKINEIREILSFHGYSDEAMDFLFLASYRLYDEETIRTLFLRGEIDENKLFERMREIGYTDTRIKEIIKTWSLIPGPSDLFHLVAKEAFEPDMIDHYGYMDEFPEEQVQWLEKQGLSRYWAEKYWSAHWETPSIQMGYEMLHRGIIDFKELDDLFRTIEIPPFWRDKLTQLAYQPYTRVDTRRMFEEGIIGIEEVYNSYLDQGYPPERALNLTKYAIISKNKKEKDITVSLILKSYESRTLNRDEAKQMVVNLDYTEDKAELMLIQKDFEIEEEISNLKIKNIEDRYVNRLINKFEAMARLNALNLPSEKVDVLLDKWEIIILKDNKIPSKSDVEKFFSAGTITEKEYREIMNLLGYKKDYVDMYVKYLSGKGK